jgi:predicted N-acetyltransferase YhbS
METGRQTQISTLPQRGEGGSSRSDDPGGGISMSASRQLLPFDLPAEVSLNLCLLVAGEPMLSSRWEEICSLRFHPLMPRRNEQLTACEPCLAEENDIQEIDSLLCSAKEPIGLTERFCESANYPKREQWFQHLRERNLLWVIRDAEGIVGLLILEEAKFGEIVGIAYVVVAEHLRGRGEIGPRLVRQAQALSKSLRAEARNGSSCLLLRKCGFRKRQEVSPSGHPILTWSSA